MSSLNTQQSVQVKRSSHSSFSKFRKQEAAYIQQSQYISEHPLFFSINAVSMVFTSKIRVSTLERTHQSSAKIRVYNTSVFNSASTYQKVVGLIGHGSSTLIEMSLSRSNNEQRFIFTLITFKSFAYEESYTTAILMFLLAQTLTLNVRL